MPVDAKLQAIRLAMDQIEKQYGKGSIMRLGEQAQKNMGIDVISTGILPLDLALGVGGLPRGRIVEIYGPEASGKTTVCLSTIAEAQKTGEEAIVLFSPACASFDQFSDFEARGEAFRAAVHALTTPLAAREAHG